MYVSRNMDHWQDFIDILKIAFQQDKGQELLTLLLTADERDAVGLRLQIIDQLINGNIPQREIQQQLNTSVATITRGSNMIKMMPPEFIQWIKEQLNEKKRKNEK